VMAFDTVLGSQVKRLPGSQKEMAVLPECSRFVVTRKIAPNTVLLACRPHSRGTPQRWTSEERRSRRSRPRMRLSWTMNRMMASMSRANQVSLLCAYACLLEPSTLNNSNLVPPLTALPLLGFVTELLCTLSAVPFAIPSRFIDCAI